MDATQLRRAAFPVGILLLLFFFVSECVPKPITDLRSVKVSRVPASSLPLADSLHDTLTERGGAVWKVSLTGAAEWIRQVKRHELNSYVTVVRCDEPDYGVLSLGPYVGQVPVTYYGKGFRDFEPRSGIVQYDVYLPETGRYRSQTDFNAPMPTYDLGSRPLPLCLRIAGGSMIGAYNRSNEVRVDVGGVH